VDVFADKLQMQNPGFTNTVYKSGAVHLMSRQYYSNFICMVISTRYAAAESWSGSAGATSIRMLEKYGKDITLCPKCKSGKLMLIHIDYGGYETKPVKMRLTITDSNGQNHEPP